MKKYFMKYPSGLIPDIVDWRNENRDRILEYFKGTQDDWSNYRWQLRHVIRDAQPLLDLVELTTDQRRAVQKASENEIPFGITPYYLSLMDRDLSIGYDHAVRAQVIPPADYVDSMVAHRMERLDSLGKTHHQLSL